MLAARKTSQLCLEVILTSSEVQGKTIMMDMMIAGLFSLIQKLRCRANTLQKPTYEKSDRVLVSIEWEQKFPLAQVDALSRKIYDHTPLLLSAKVEMRIKQQSQFKFKLGLLLADDFFPTSLTNLK